MGVKDARRSEYFSRLTALMEKYPKILIVHADHVGSRQMAEIRFSLRGKAIILMGKNTMIRTCLKGMTGKSMDKLLQEIKLNVGLVFCIADPCEVRTVILANKVPTVARQGIVAPCDVEVPPGSTGLDAGQTSFFQALGVGTKIVKGCIEIQSAVHLIKQGDRVTPSQSVLLQKLNLKPFAFGLVPKKIYDSGSVYDAAVLDLTDDDILKKFQTGVQNVAALSRAIGMPTEASITHCIVEGFKHCAALCIESGNFNFPKMETLRKFVEDPSAFASAAPAAAAAAAPVAEAKKEAEPEEESEEDDFGFDLFG